MENVVSLLKIKEKGKRKDAVMLLEISRNVQKLQDVETREMINDALRGAIIAFLAASF